MTLLTMLYYAYQGFMSELCITAERCGKCQVFCATCVGNMGYIGDGKSKGASFCYRLRALWQSNMSSNLLWVCYLQAAVMAALATAFNFKLKWAVTGAGLAF